jgi:ferric-dicitrate binding protein FerR (iron transport regulator)
VLAVILIFGHNAKLMESRNNEHMLSLLDSISLNVDEIQVVSGSIQTQVCNNETIKQTKSGDVFVGEKEKIKSTDIETKFLQLVVPRGRRTSIKFSDGTVAWVNSGSKLVYPKSFTGKKREIFIEGEIYLEVTKDASKPFCVHSKKFDVVVLGTKFNINAYKEDTENSVVLVDGSVEVTTKSDFKQKLRPNQGLFFVNESVKMEDVDASSYISWKDGILKVNGESLGSIFNKLSRFYNVTINYDQSLALEKYRGKLELNDSIEFVLDNLSFTSQFNYVKDENGIQIRM